MGKLYLLLVKEWNLILKSISDLTTKRMFWKGIVSLKVYLNAKTIIKTQRMG